MNTVWLRPGRRLLLALFLCLAPGLELRAVTAAETAACLQAARDTAPQAALTEEELRRWWHWVQHADRTPPGTAPERRIKQINLNFREAGEGGYMETADPTRPIEVEMPDGTKRLLVLGSGRYAFDIRDGELDNLLRGGVRGRSRIPIDLHFSDGRRMRGPYHTGSLPWDLLLVKWPVDMLDISDPRRAEAEKKGERFVYVGYGGTMEQPYRMEGARSGARRLPVQIPKGLNHNPSRSRHAFDVEFKDGRMVWRDQGSIFGHRPSVEGEWLGERHEHGYGGRPILNKDGTPWRDAHGKAWMLFERIVEEEIRYEDGRVVTQRKGADGRLTISDADGAPLSSLPEGKIARRVAKVTEMFARRMKNPYEAYGRDEKFPDGTPAGEEVAVLGVRPGGDESKPPYAASDRGGNEGFLLEGFNHTEATVEGKPFHLITGSNGNFVDGNSDGKGYGASLAFRHHEDGPIGRYEPVEVKGPGGADLMNFTTAIGKKYGIIWGPARPDLFQDSRGEWWMIAHGVPEHTLPAGLPRGGWPRTAEEFNHYYRAAFLFPVKLSLKDGRPWLEVEDPRPELLTPPPSAAP